MNDLMDRQLAAEFLVAAVFGAEFLVHRRQAGGGAEVP